MRRTCLSLLLSLLIALSASAVTMAWTPIDNPGNACETRPANGFHGGCFGAVGYSYSIGTYEVTNAQYAEFLNAKAASDPLGLYNTSMAGSLGGITRAGVSGSYTYSVIAGRADRPVNVVSFYDALRFTNWINNGQGGADTETGAYTLLGGTPTPSNGNTVTRNPGAIIVLTSEDEWYKAAYYDAASASYFDYPTGSNTQPTCAGPTATPNRANCNFAVSNTTIKGSYAGSASPYGTFDQGGNVYEWNEAIIIDPTRSCPSDVCRGIQGGSYATQAIFLWADTGDDTTPTGENTGIGFRLAYIPEPSTGLLVIAGLLGFAVRRRGRA